VLTYRQDSSEALFRII